ncbi:MAG TPA: glycine cleavage system aminomethyltransferase GcvT [Candidatus Thermoplasmatota archaeon]|nr:glycine cleavage system aminomethyltransferase GcvT [Candidatus Thermoplasmatota archaeon]
MALRTTLYDAHAGLGATFTEFAGYDMPVHYGSINDEHHAVRTAAGLFDVSHMSKLWVEGAGAARAIARVTPSLPAALPDGKGKYTVALRGDGTILDDLFVFRLAADRFFVVPNAGRNEAVASHLKAHAPAGTRVLDETPAWAILALQGPRAKEVLAACSKDAAPRFHHIATMSIAGVRCLASGTGYTGEKGVEIYTPAAEARAVWNALLGAGRPLGLRPIGLGARDTLRLEKGYCLAGNEFEGGRTPIEAGLEWTMEWGGDFLGKARLLAQKASGDHDRLVALVQEKGVPRHGYAILKGTAPAGKVTSGTMSPTLGKGIALGYARGLTEGDAAAVDVRGRPQPARVVKTPFV